MDRSKIRIEMIKETEKLKLKIEVIDRDDIDKKNINVLNSYFNDNYIEEEVGDRYSLHYINDAGMWGEYNRDNYRGYNICKVSNQLSKKNIEVKDKINVEIVNYLYQMPIHVEILEEYKLRNLNDKYEFLNIIVKSNNCLSPKEINSEYVIANLLLDENIGDVYFGMVYSQFIFHKNDDSSSSIDYYDILCCVKKGMSELRIRLVKDKVEKMRSDLEVSISVLENGLYFLNRETFINHIDWNKFYVLHEHYGIFFSKFNMDLVDYYRLAIFARKTKKSNFNEYRLVRLYVEGLKFFDRYDYEEKRVKNINKINNEMLYYLCYYYVYIPSMSYYIVNVVRNVWSEIKHRIEIMIRKRLNKE